MNESEDDDASEGHPIPPDEDTDAATHEPPF